MQPGQITRCESTSWDLAHRRTVPIGLTAEIITVRDTLESYAGEWNALLEQSGARTIFLTWEWISAWLEAVYPDAELLVVFVRDREARLAAIAPFYRSQMRFLRLVSYRCLRVLGDFDSGAEYPDIIVRRGCEGNAIPVLREALLDQHHAWDCLWLPALAGWTGAMPRLHDLCARRTFYLHERRHDFGSMDLPDTHDAYLKSLSANARSNIKRHTKRLYMQIEHPTVAEIVKTSHRPSPSGQCRKPQAIPGVVLVKQGLPQDGDGVPLAAASDNDVGVFCTRIKVPKHAQAPVMDQAQ